ncbi:hypothetical protein KEM56_005065, partial [Ascosphaera pollenicola]
MADLDASDKKRDTSAGDDEHLNGNGNGNREMHDVALTSRPASPRHDGDGDGHASKTGGDEGQHDNPESNPWAGDHNGDISAHVNQRRPSQLQFRHDRAYDEFSGPSTPGTATDMDASQVTTPGFEHDREHDDDDNDDDDDDGDDHDDGEGGDGEDTPHEQSRNNLAFTSPENQQNQHESSH